MKIVPRLEISVEYVPHAAKFMHAFCLTYSVGLPFLKSLYPCYQCAEVCLVDN